MDHPPVLKVEYKLKVSLEASSPGYAQPASPHSIPDGLFLHTASLMDFPHLWEHQSYWISFSLPHLCEDPVCKSSHDRVALPTSLQQNTYRLGLRTSIPKAIPLGFSTFVSIKHRWEGWLIQQ